VWAQDEARLGLKPIARRVWTLRGHRPNSNGRHKFASLYVFGYAHPATGRNRTTIVPKANTQTMTESLSDFARWADPEGAKVLVVLLDRAGWHVAKKLRVPSNVVLFHLPSSCNRSSRCGRWCGRAWRTRRSPASQRYRSR
jgi:hypothetical protein